jgi:SAM-dependent methyltransferase
MTRYSYPDQDDVISLAFIDEQEPYPGYWDASDRKALGRLGNQISGLLPARHSVWALDAGCGEGRALPWIAGFAERITAIDPDPARLAKASARALPPRTDARFENVPISYVGGGPYQLIVCNHVVQHVSTSLVREILTTFKRVATPETLLVLSYSRSPVGGESYGIARMADGVTMFERTDRLRFDRLTESGGRPGYLPVRLIDPAAFAADALTAGWATAWSWTFHLMGQPTDALGQDRDEAVNADPALLERSNGDIYVLMRPSL